MARGRRAQRDSEVALREATKDDVYPVADALDDATHAELVAMTGLAVRDALMLDYADSGEVWFVHRNGKPLALGGVSPDEEQSPSAAVWLVCTPAAKKTPRCLIRTLRELVQTTGRRHGLLYGYVDARNLIRQRWLGTLGFMVNTEETIRLGHLGLPFYQFISTSHIEE